MKRIEFSKLNGQGNDFIIIDSFTEEVILSPLQIISMCDRHFGIGADGLILVKKSKLYDFFMDYYNQDGTRAEMCGNGIRCMSRFIYDRQLCSDKKFCIETLAGKKVIELETAGGNVGNIIVDMGPPVFDPERIPVNIKGTEIFGYRLNTEAGDFVINCVSMGNPHCIIYLEDDKDLKSIPLETWGPVIGRHKIFPNETNVEFIKVTGKNELEMRVWERGAGETLACGTGACAAGVSAFKLGKIDGPSVIVKVPGGILNIIWEKPSSNVFLEAMVEHNFDGVYYI